ncbi:SusD/RagB family nutrient-binding outer membrane lipoprotein [Gelidibacter gilvus]|uniref:SusD/RagB family nutrient-binding outer membrane lipoprotein n=1 Tax=Gelidibacter gilvus TaxID=59602 RepID=A0A4Q0XJ64_9FLAO|nr:SusD/RagB family nutrient-binding outer membrane lipoprotein [Gelidibacter gilvus]RXJ50045.1 SusD/RagB family nutrient-binding outer membrane lipoprotein [Gelidibacter gilvus]
MKYKHIIAIVTILVAFSSCTKDFDTLIEDPIALSPNPDGQLSFVQLSMSGDRYYQWRANLIYSGGFVQHYSGAWNVTEFGGRFKKNDDYAHAYWRRAYSIEMKNIVDIIARTNDIPEKANINAIAKIVRVMIGQRLTDLYGDVPYSEAGVGFSQGIVAPRYDKQEEIYRSFFVDLEESFNQLNVDGGTVTGDLFYNGDITKWKKLANTLRLRTGMRISEIAPAEAEKQVKAALANGVFESNADNCIMRHGDIAFNGDLSDYRGNGLAHAFIGNDNADHFTSLLIDFLKDHDDPRLPMIATPKTSSGVSWGGPIQPGEDLYVGVPSGSFQWDVFGGAAATSGIQDYLKENTTPFLHVSYSETQLLLAEAAFRGWVSGSAADYYQNGVEAGVKQLALYGAAEASQGDINSFLAANPLQTGKELEQINTQLWVTYLFNSIEAYSNWRRTGFPVLDPITVPDSETGGVVPKRLYYPNDELQKNETNYLEAIGRMGGNNDWLNKVWWDAN